MHDVIRPPRPPVPRPSGLRPVRRAVAAALALGLLASCSASADDAEPAPPSPMPYPGTEWAVADPSSVGLDAAPLAAMDADLQARDSDCVAVVRDGVVVHEQAWNGTAIDDDREAFSASKSVTSALVGIAQEQGHLSIDQPASDFITEWKGTPSESVTIRNLLSNDSGRYYEFVNDYSTMAAQAPDKTAFAIDLDQQYPPGAEWAYNNSAIQTLEAVLERSTGQDVEAFAQENLFRPIGMSSTIARDAAGNPLTFMGTQASCLDLARFGYLFLRGGRWEGEQVVPDAWVDQSTDVSQSLQPKYGFLWWLNQDGAPQWDLPEDAFAAIGLGGQISLVVPSWNLVATRMGRGSAGDGGGAGIIDVMAGHLRRAVEGPATPAPGTDSTAP